MEVFVRRFAALVLAGVVLAAVIAPSARSSASKSSLAATCVRGASSS